MPLLYEHYVLGLLREAYGNQIRYQEPGHTGYPDSSATTRYWSWTRSISPAQGQTKISSDTSDSSPGYARDRMLFKDPITEPIPCLVIYPEEGTERNPFRDKPLRELLLEIEEEKSAWGFYRLAVPLPTLR